MQSQLRDVEQRVKSYWFADGLAELIGGAAFLIIGSYFLLVELNSQAWWVGVLQAAFILIFLGAVYGGRKLIATLKDRYVYPRTGYIEYRVDKKSAGLRRVLAGITGVVVAAILVIFAPVEGRIDWVVALTSLVVGAVLMFGQARSAGHERFMILGLASVLLGMLLAVSGWPNGIALGLYYGGIGLASMVSGALVFQRFLRENPVRSEGSDGL